MTTFKKILVPTDFSEHADAALDAAIDLATRTGASVTLAYVLEPNVYVIPESGWFAEHPADSRATEDVRRTLQKLKANAIARGAKNIDTVQLNGYPPVEIARCAKDGDFDLIAMGTHGRRGFSHLFMGSVAERVVRTAPCAVLTVRSEQAKERAKAPKSQDVAHSH